MSKPILWLGPLEEIDADFDPLLGRSAAAPQGQPAPLKTKSAMDPSRSVFDDPVPEVTAPIANDTGWTQPEPIAQEPVPVLSPEPAIASGPDADLPLPELAPEPEPAPNHEPVGEINDEPVVLEPKAEPALVAEISTDYAHNNDPIPAGVQEIHEATPDDRTSAFSPAFGDDVEAVVAPQEEGPKKSFFTNLFTRRTITPAAVGIGASINEIWAKSERVPEPAVEAEAETSNQPPEPETLPETLPEADLAPQAAQLEPVETQYDLAETPVAVVEPETTQTPLRGRNIWEDVDEVPSDSGALEAISDEPETTPEEPIADEPVTAYEATTQEPALVAEEPSAETSFPETQSSEPVKTTWDPVVEDGPEDRVEDAIEEQVQEQIPEEVPSTTNFQKAFNADQFWSLPRGTNPPHPETESRSDGIETGDESPTTPLTDNNAEDRAAENLGTDPQAQASPVTTPRVRQGASGKRRKKKPKKNYVGAFCGTFLFGIALIMTLVSSLAAFGYPFDLMSSYRWYWVILAVLSAGIFGISRGWKMVAAAFAVVAVNLFVTVPASGKAPSGGNSATAVVGWANVSGNADALARVFKDADKKKATLLMLAEAPQSVFTPPAGWTLIEAPAAGDLTAIAVLSKSTWRAATVPGEPTMARPPSGDLTVIGVHPQDAIKSRRSTPNRDALINRAGTRAGIQEGPTVVLGDFNAAPWDRAITQFRSYGNVTRVRCGGWAGSTLTQAFGFIGVATDHAFVRDVKVTHCQLGGSLPGGNHKPIWLYVTPQPAPPAEAVQP